MRIGCCGFAYGGSAVLRVAPASALTVAETSPAGAPLRCREFRPRGAYSCRGLACGFWGVSRKWAPISPRFWTSVRFSTGVVRYRLRRPEETSAPGGVSGRFGLRNRPEVANGACGSLGEHGGCCRARRLRRRVSAHERGCSRAFGAVRGVSRQVAARRIARNLGPAGGVGG